MEITIKAMETEEEIRGKARVHWQAWHEAYTGLIRQDFLDEWTLEACTRRAFRWTDGTLVAKDGDRVVGFVCFGDRGEEAPGVGEIFALYILAEYYGTGLGQMLLHAGLDTLRGYQQVCLWVLKGNLRAIRFYEKCGFRFDGSEMLSTAVGAWEQRMIREN